MTNKTLIQNLNVVLDLKSHTKPKTKAQFAHWLAGLIDADGHISKHGYVQIEFHKKDLRLIYYIKKLIGFGKVYKYKKVNACRYTCANKAGLMIICNLIHNKLRLHNKIEQFNTRLAPRLGSKLSSFKHTAVSVNNWWFAGFVQGDGCFQIKLRKLGPRSKNQQVELVLGIELKQRNLLEQIKRTFGGIISYRKSRQTYAYSSVNLSNACKLVAYFDRFQVLGPSYKLYLCWKAALNIVLKKHHLSHNGLEEIKKLKAHMTKLRL